MIRSELLVAFFFVLLSICALTPVLLVSLGAYSGSIVERIEALLLERQELLIALGTLFLVVGLSVWASHLANRSAEIRDSANRALMAEIKVAEFRQSWINDLRDELEEFSQITFSKIKDRDHVRLSAVMNKIRIRLNLSEDAQRELWEAMLSAARHDHKDVDAEITARLLVSEKANAFLRGEWGRMKRDIKNALTFVENEP